MIEIDLEEWRNDVRTYGALSELKTLALLDRIVELEEALEHSIHPEVFDAMQAHAEAAEAKLEKVRELLLGAEIDHYDYRSMKPKMDAIIAILDETE